MATYHQMGHDSWNLIDENSLQGYAGLILSPVNNSPTEVADRLARLGSSRVGLEVILDPQFYQPTSDRGQLSTWDHLGDDIDTADLTDHNWWDARCRLLLQAAGKVNADAVCSPAILPRAFDDEYYRHVIDCTGLLARMAAGSKFALLTTAIVNLPELAQKDRVEHITSILTSSAISRVYLVFHDGLFPRTNRTDQLAMIGAAKLIRQLKEAGMSVLAAFSGLDVVVWKAAGATDAATGKFFNLRRFVPGRWQEPQEGGRNIPYWTDDSLIAWLREDDLRLLDNRGLIDRDAAVANPYSAEILKIIDSGQATAWLALSWRQYLYWFRQVEMSISTDPDQAMRMLIAADQMWKRIGDERIYLRDRENTGDWIRPWMNAISQSLA